MRVFEQDDLMIAATTAKVTDADGNVYNVFEGTAVPPHLAAAYIEATGQESEGKGKVQTEPESTKLQTKPERHTAQEEPERSASENPIVKAVAKKAAARRRSSN